METIEARQTEAHPTWCGRNRCYDTGDQRADHAAEILTVGPAEGALEQSVQWTFGSKDTGSLLGVIRFNVDYFDDLTRDDCVAIAAVATALADKLKELEQ